jgi:hypothetical protein
MATTQTPFSHGPQSKSSPKFQYFGVWNPEEGWLIDSSIPVADGSILWTQNISQAQVFRTEAAALLATKHLRDFSQIITAVRPLDHAVR